MTAAARRAMPSVEGMIRLPPRASTVAVYAVACVVLEVALLGWWAATRATILFVALQLVLVVLVWLGLLIIRYRGFRHDYEQAIATNAILADRSRLADELHDALGHELSLIALKAGNLQVRTTGAVQEQAADIRRDVAKAVEQLHRALESAREDATSESVDAMIDRLTASGVSISQTGRRPPRLPTTVEHGLHQVLRETLTNALTHAPGRPVTIAYRTDPDVVAVEVRNPMPSDQIQRTRTSTSASGLEALGRRLALSGGRLDHMVEDGEFVVAARIPRHPTSTPADVGARRRSPLRRTVASALVPTTVAVLVLIGFYAWSTHDDVVEDSVFARLRVGIPAPTAERLLPPRQAPVRLVPTHAHDPEWSCAYYTDGNFPLGLAVFEVCSDEGVVVRLTDLRKQSWL